MQSVVYKDNSKDPRPAVKIKLKDPNDPFHRVADILDYVEKRQFEIHGVDRLIHHEINYTPSVVRQQKFSSSILPIMMRRTAEFCVRHGFQYSVGIATGEASKRNVTKLHYKFPESTPVELYKDSDGKSWKAARNEKAWLFYLDMYEAHKNKIFG